MHCYSNFYSRLVNDIFVLSIVTALIMVHIVRKVYLLTLVASIKKLEFDRNSNSNISMSKGDLLISDVSSFKFDFAFLYKKPGITMKVPL